MQKTWTDDYLAMVVDCERQSTQLSDWENAFIESIRRQLESGRVISYKQTEVLDTIWNKATHDRKK